MTVAADAIADELIKPPPGRYAIGLSGGADSVALTRLSLGWPDVEVTLVHLNHRLRAAESDEDEHFVRQLAEQLDLPLVVAGPGDDRSSNRPARYRAWRIALFKSVVDERGLAGALLAHHGDDRAESILMRLSRGGSPVSLRLMSQRSRVGGIDLFRPLLSVRAAALRTYLRRIGQGWREDSSNNDLNYRRNAARKLLLDNEPLYAALTKLGRSAERVVEVLEHHSPTLSEEFNAARLATFPPPLAEHAARRWLTGRGCPADRVSPAVCRRLVTQALDPQSSSCQHYPGGISVVRRGGIIAVR